MWIENDTFREDLERICDSAYLPWAEFAGKTVFITGATGLIGYTAASAFMFYALRSGCRIDVLLLVRDEERARRLFKGQMNDGCNCRFIEGSLEKMPSVPSPVDYIIHCACPTDSAFFTTNPTETICSIFIGTRNVLALARDKKASGMVYLSSMEVYGQIKCREKLGEQDLGYINPLSVRSSYSEGKRMAENLCCAYAHQYDVPVTIVRLAQTFGPGVKSTDSRVFAYMARCALACQDIHLKTSGLKENMYLYTMDAVSAILLLLLRGTRGDAYNAANESTYCSIKDMARTVLDTLGAPSAKVCTNVGGDNQGLYRPEGYLNLNVEKLKALGWRPMVNLPEMYLRMVKTFSNTES
ncbi:MULTISPECIES: NAD-dependent epimerase/dehydratase family protein [Eubacteriales]|uniref:NAD-dependent epimerase/dehydratase family protein n=1 Tax=Eubacteriales TaxID=186802 RepID=UPI00026F43FC|nr:MULTISPECIES: NAD(P)-dependent oxidoreductase [Eubacteriales]EJF41014.1 3-beta hydroxysteroid dehydrogenase/isomerase family protein [Clostridium sp. MSTE9]